MVRCTTKLEICLNISKRQNHTKIPSQKIINDDIIVLTLHHSFNKRVKCRFVLTMKVDSSESKTTRGSD